MVLTNQEYGLANTKRQFDPKLEALFQLRGATKSYIVQCVTDREIQKMLASEHPSKAYTFNCYVVHSPVKYCRVNHLFFAFFYINL